MSILKNSFNNLSKSKKDLLIQKLLERKRLNKTSVNSIPRVDNSKPLRLSYAQQRLWFIEQLQPGSSAYNIPVALRLKGQMEVLGLEYAFNRLMYRHQSMRTRFAEIDSQPVQIIEEYQSISLEIESKKGIKQNELRELIDEEAGKSFDLGKGRLIRIRLWEIGEEEYVLMIVMHHIITDGWSMGVIVRELVESYRAYQEKGGEVEIADGNCEGLQYGDYAEWQRERLESGEGERQEAYWREKLKGVEGYAEIAGDYKRPIKPTFEGEVESVQIKHNYYQLLKEIIKSLNCTTNFFVLSVLSLMISHLSKEDKVIIGTPVNNRNLVEVQELVGIFLNTVMIIVDISKSSTFEELLLNVKSVSLEAYSNQDIPFEKIVEAVRPNRNSVHTPFFQVAYTLQNEKSFSIELPNLKLEAIEVNSGTVQFDLVLNMIDFNEGLGGAFLYSRELFEPLTIKKIKDQFLKIFETVCENPKETIENIRAELLKAEAERKSQIENQFQSSLAQNLRKMKRKSISK